MQKTISEKNPPYQPDVPGITSIPTENSLSDADENNQAILSERTRILRDRARSLAVSNDEESLSTEVLDIVRFEFGEQHFGLERHFVVQVGQFGEIVPLPSTPDFLVGLVNVRGRIFPVYNLLRILGFAEPGISDAHQILHLHAGDLDICLLADKINAAESLPISELQPPLQNVTAHGTKFVRGITAERLVVIDAGAILASTAIVINHPTEQ